MTIMMTTAELERGDWVRPSGGRLVSPAVRCVDVSGSGSYGYQYALVRESQIGEARPEHLAESVTIWLTDGSPLMGPAGSGAAVTRFRGADYRAALARASE